MLCFGWVHFVFLGGEGYKRVHYSQDNIEKVTMGWWFDFYCKIFVQKCWKEKTLEYINWPYGSLVRCCITMSYTNICVQIFTIEPKMDVNMDICAITHFAQVLQSTEFTQIFVLTIELTCGLFRFRRPIATQETVREVKS